MRVFSIAKGFHKLTKNIPPELSPKELDRLRAITIWGKTKDVLLVCKTFGISRATFYRWLRRYDSKDLRSLRDKSRRPRRLREAKWSYELIMAVKEIRQQYPRWGKEKLMILLSDRGYKTSASTVGRILKYLKRRGEIVEPKTNGISAKRRWKRPYAVRKPSDYSASEPGDLVQVDTLDIRPLPGIILKQFTARDSISKWDTIEARTRATSFLHALVQNLFWLFRFQLVYFSNCFSEFHRHKVYNRFNKNSR